MRCLEVDAAGLLGNQIFLFASGTGIAAELNASLCLARPLIASGKHLLVGVLQGQQPCRCARHANVTTAKLPHESSPIGLTDFRSALQAESTFYRYVGSEAYHGYQVQPSSCTGCNGSDVSLRMPFPVYLQSHWYWSRDPAVEAEVLQRVRWISPIVSAARGVLSHLLEPGDIPVGVHVRVAGRKHSGKQNIAPGAYFRSAMDLMRQRHGPRVRFVVCSDAIRECEKAQWFQGKDVHFSHHNVSVAGPVSEGTYPAVDMAILSLCAHVILSIGTFGWWGAYLGPRASGLPPGLKRDVLYFGDEFKKAYKDALMFRSDEFYPEEWTPMVREGDGFAPAGAGFRITGAFVGERESSFQAAARQATARQAAAPDRSDGRSCTPVGS